MDNIHYKNNPIINLNKLQHISYSQLICMQNHAEWFFVHDKATYVRTSGQIQTHWTQNTLRNEPKKKLYPNQSSIINNWLLLIS